MKKGEQTFRARLERHLDELKWLYMELYDDESQFAYLLEQLHQFYEERKPALKRLDERREQDGDWYRKPGMTGMMLYVEQFAGTLARGKGKA